MTLLRLLTCLGYEEKWATVPRSHEGRFCRTQEARAKWLRYHSYRGGLLIECLRIRLRMRLRLRLYVATWEVKISKRVSKRRLGKEFPDEGSQTRHISITHVRSISRTSNDGGLTDLIWRKIVVLCEVREIG